MRGRGRDDALRIAYTETLYDGGGVGCITLRVASKCTACAIRETEGSEFDFIDDSRVTGEDDVIANTDITALMDTRRGVQ